MRNFLWSGLEDQQRVSWVNWKDVCKPKEYGGLGIREWGAFNKALLGKWRWHFLNEKENLWCRVIRAKYVFNEVGKPILVPTKTSGWWKDIVEICYNDQDGWFQLNLSNVIGDGREVSFWNEVWACNDALKIKFNRLYNLSNQKLGKISDMGFWDEGVWRWNFSWRRGLLDRELMWVEDLINQVSHVVLKEDTVDKWSWGASNSGQYSVKSAFDVIQRGVLEELNVIFKNIWKVVAPSNVVGFVWRVMRGRIQTRLNLRRRGIILDEEAVICPLCCKFEESVDHFLFSCDVSDAVWKQCYRWLGYEMALPQNCIMHFQQHVFGAWSEKQKWGVWSIWYVGVWAIWLERNKVIFQQAIFQQDKIVDQIKFRSWLWLKAKKKDFNFSLFEWWMNPNQCLQGI